MPGNANCDRILEVCFVIRIIVWFASRATLLAECVPGSRQTAVNADDLLAVGNQTEFTFFFYEFVFKLNRMKIWTSDSEVHFSKMMEICNVSTPAMRRFQIRAVELENSNFKNFIDS